MNEAEEVLGLLFPASREPSPALEPGEETFDFPASLVATQLPAIGFEAATRALIRRDEFDAALCFQTLLKHATVPRFVGNQSRRQLLYESSVESSLGENAVESVSSINMDSERKTIAVCNRHEFRRIAGAAPPDAGPPFFAGT